MKFKVGDKVRVRGDLSLDVMNGVVSSMLNYRNCVYTIADITADGVYCKLDGNEWAWTEEMLEPADNIVRMADGTIIGDFSTGGVIPTSEWDKLVFKNGSSIEVLPQKDDTVRGENHFCTGFKGGKIPTPEKPVTIEETAEYFRQQLISNCGVSQMFFSNRSSGKRVALNALVDSYSKLGCTSFLMSRNEIEKIIKEDKPMAMFTFSTEEGYHYDKSNNTKIPTITTKVICTSYDSVYHGAATCDKSNYDERQGCLEAIANAMFGGNFDKQYRKAVKFNNTFDLAARTCDYCGKVFDTADERREHEAWHVERRKARRERYLLRKRAKEIAFEEQAQKMAKEMMGEQK